LNPMCPKPIVFLGEMKETMVPVLMEIIFRENPSEPASEAFPEPGPAEGERPYENLQFWAALAGTRRLLSSGRAWGSEHEAPLGGSFKPGTTETNARWEISEQDPAPVVYSVLYCCGVRQAPGHGARGSRRASAADAATVGPAGKCPSECNLQRKLQYRRSGQIISFKQSRSSRYFTDRCSADRAFEVPGGLISGNWEAFGPRGEV